MPARDGPYVALGDSYTAAPWVGAVTGPVMCLRSRGNYPSLVANALHIEDFVDRSCSGATTADLTGEQNGLAPQVDALGSGTRLVTVGIGGNDGGLFGLVVAECTAPAMTVGKVAPCRGMYGSVRQPVMRKALATVATNVTRVLRRIRSLAPHARVILVGYPQIVPADRTCAQLPLAPGDYAWGRSVNKGLDDALQTAASATGVTYLDMWGPSAGHAICSTDPWIQGGRSEFGKALAYHPFAAEQEEVARLIVRLLGSDAPVVPPTTAAGTS